MPPLNHRLQLNSVKSPTHTHSHQKPMKKGSPRIWQYLHDILEIERERESLIEQEVYRIYARYFWNGNLFATLCTPLAKVILQVDIQAKEADFAEKPGSSYGGDHQPVFGLISSRLYFVKWATRILRRFQIDKMTMMDHLVIPSFDQ